VQRRRVVRAHLGIARIEGECAPVVWNRLREFSRLEIEVAERRKRSDVVRIALEPVAHLDEQPRDGRRRPGRSRLRRGSAADAVGTAADARVALRCCRPKCGARDAEADFQEVADDTEKPEHHDENDGDVDSRRQAAGGTAGHGRDVLAVTYKA